MFRPESRLSASFRARIGALALTAWAAALLFTFWCASPTGWAQGRLPEAFTQLREWTNEEGKSITAGILRFKDGHEVMLRMQDGRVFTTTLDSFSDESQKRLLEIRLKHGFSVTPDPTGRVVYLYPLDLSAQERDTTSFAYLGIGKIQRYFRIHLNSGGLDLTNYPFIEFWAGPEISARFPIPFLGVRKSITSRGDRAAFIDMMFTDPDINKLALIKDHADWRVNLIDKSGGFKTLDIPEDARDQITSLMELYYDIRAHSPNAEWRESILEPENYGVSLTPRLIPLDARPSTRWTDALGRGVDASPTGFFKDLVFLQGPDGKHYEMPLVNLDTDDRRRLLDRRLNECYATWGSDDPSRGDRYYGPKSWTAGQRDSEPHIVVAKSVSSYDSYLWISVASPTLREPEKLFIYPDGRTEGIEVPFASRCYRYQGNVNNETWYENWFYFSEFNREFGAVGNARALRMELRQGDESFWIELPPEHRLFLQDGVSLYQEIQRLKGIK